MPIKRLDRTRENLPVGYQYGDAKSVVAPKEWAESANSLNMPFIPRKDEMDDLSRAKHAAVFQIHV